MVTPTTYTNGMTTVVGTLAQVMTAMQTAEVHPGRIIAFFSEADNEVICVYS